MLPSWKMQIWKFLNGRYSLFKSYKILLDTILTFSIITIEWGPYHSPGILEWQRPILATFYIEKAPRLVWSLSNTVLSILLYRSLFLGFPTSLSSFRSSPIACLYSAWHIIIWATLSVHPQLTSVEVSIFSRLSSDLTLLSTYPLISLFSVSNGIKFFRYEQYMIE